MNIFMKKFVQFLLLIFLIFPFHSSYASYNYLGTLYLIILVAAVISFLIGYFIAGKENGAIYFIVALGLFLICSFFAATGGIKTSVISSMAFPLSILVGALILRIRLFFSEKPQKSNE